MSAAPGSSSFAFACSVPVSVSQLSPKFERNSSLPVIPCYTIQRCSPRVQIRMGYGSYSYLTDKTQGHTNQYYIDKFRRAEDAGRFISPSSDDDAMFGCTAKGTIKVPKQGIPEPRDSALPPIDPTAPEDPRIAEAEGSLYPWDARFNNPDSDSSDYEDINDEQVSADSFSEFRKAVSDLRGDSLSNIDSRALHRRQRLKAGLDETYMLTIDGQHDIRHMRTEKMANPSVVSRTETGYPQPVSALDFILGDASDNA